RIFLLHPLQRFLSRPQLSFELLSLCCLKNFATLRTGLLTERAKILPPHQWWRDDRLGGEFFALPQEKFVIVEHAMAALAIDPMQLQLVIKSWPRHEAF